MPSDKKNSGLPARPLSALDASLISKGASVSFPADTSLSAAFRHVLGHAPSDSPLPGSVLKPGQDLARRAKNERPEGTAKTVARKNHIGPRSGHK